MMDVNEIENQRKVSEFDRFISKFSINLESFVDLNVSRYCSIEINGNKEKTSRIFCLCRRPVYGPVATRGGEIFVHLIGMVCPWVGNLTAKL